MYLIIAHRGVVKERYIYKILCEIILSRGTSWGKFKKIIINKIKIRSTTNVNVKWTYSPFCTALIKITNSFTLRTPFTY